MNEIESVYNELKDSILKANDKHEVGAAKYEINFMDILNKVEELYLKQEAVINDLKSNESKFREIFNSTNEAIFIHDSITGTILDTNNRAVEMYGFENKEELLTVFMGDLCANILPYTIEKGYEYISKSLTEGPQTFDWLAKRKNGDYFWVAISLKKSVVKGDEIIIAVVRDISVRKAIENTLIESEKKYRTLFETMNEGIVYQDSEGIIINANPAAERLLGLSLEQMIGKNSFDPCWKTISENGDALIGDEHPAMLALKTGKEIYNQVLGIYNPLKNSYIWLNMNSIPLFNEDKKQAYQVFTTFDDITEKKQAQDILKRRILSLTMPLESDLSVDFADLFNIEDIQKLQDEISDVLGVASIITQPDGNPITKPSNFCRLCKDIIRNTDKGKINCYKSDSVIGNYNSKGPTVMRCFSGGLWDAGSGINVGGKHIANWLVGQVRDENQSEESIRIYAREIGANEDEMVKAFMEINAMSLEKFKKIANVIFSLSTQLSTMAYQNIQQARFIADKEKAEKGLKESEEKFKAAFKISPDAISISSLKDGKYLEINDGFEEISGYSRAEVIGKTAYDINIWNDLKDRDILVKALSEDGYVNNLEAVFNLKDQKHIIALMSARILNLNEEPHLLAITRDITEKKKNEQALKLAAKEWQDTFDSTADAICLLDVNQKILRANKTMLKMFDFDKNDFGIKHCWEIVHKSTSPIHNCVVNRAISSKRREHLKLELFPNTYIATADPIFDDDKQVVGIVHIIRDITDEKRIEKSLRESEERYRIVVSSSSEGIILQNKEGKILTWNKAAENVFGLKSEEIIGETSVSRNYNTFKEDGSIYKGEEHPSMITLATGKPCRDILMKVVRSDNDYSWVKVNTNPIFTDNSERPEYVVISFADITNIKTFEQAIQEREEIYSTIVNQASDAIGLIDPETAGFIEFNNTAHLMLGYSKEEYSKLTLANIEITMDKEVLFSNLKKIIITGGFEFETKHLHKNGNILNIRVNTKSVNIRGKVLIAAIWSDITESKKQEILLKEKDLIFQSLLDNSPIYVFFKDQNIKAIHLSKNFENMLGLPVENAIGKDMNDLFPSELALKMIEDDKKILNEGKLIQVDEFLNGKYFTTIKFPINRENAPPMLAGFTIDITDKKLAEIALKRSEARLAAFMEHVPALIMIKDIELRPVYANEQFKELFPFDEWMGKKPQEVFPPEIAELMIKQDNDALEKAYVSYEENWIDKKGNAHIYFTQKFRIDIPDTEPMLGVIISDITDRKNAELEVKELNQNLEKRVDERTKELIDANKELEAFAYTVSHDLRAPLRAIDGFTSILKEDYLSLFDDRGKRVCKTISDNALKMGQLIDDLLAFSRTGRNELNITLFDVKSLINSVFQDYVKEEIKQGIKLKIGNMPQINGDRAMYKQVWVNLLSNAVKFSSKREFPEIEIECKETENEFIFSIKDNGTGFDMKYVDKLFGVFQRLHNMTDYEGTGVGLAIVQRIIHRHGGKIWVEAEIDKGATFSFTVKK